MCVCTRVLTCLVLHNFVRCVDPCIHHDRVWIFPSPQGSPVLFCGNHINPLLLPPCPWLLPSPALFPISLFRHSNGITQYVTFWHWLSLCILPGDSCTFWDNLFLWKTLWGFPKKLKTALAYEPAILMLDICWKEMKNQYIEEISTFLCSQKHYSQQPRYGNNLSVYQWLNGWCSIYVCVCVCL